VTRRDDTTPRPARDRVGGDEHVAAAADVAQIGQLAEEIVPALAAKLAATGLGELEVRQGSWKIRIRRPEGGSERPARRAGDRPSRAQPGHAGHGHAPAAVEGHRPGRGQASFSTNGNQPADLAAVGPGRGTSAGPAADTSRERDPHRAVATSPAVGIFQPASGAHAGTRVRSGDRVGVVDMLGVPQEILAPVDGIVGASLVEPGDAVEYGQELIVVEQAERPEQPRERSTQPG
jgi:biotin carboxyl carrier protein